MTGLAAALVRGAVTGLGRTVRLRTVRNDRWHAARTSGRPLLLAVWHGRILLPIYRHRFEGIVAMVSLSRDGDFATAVLEGMGYGAVRGSSSHGGNAAFHALADALTAGATGATGAIIPDGPRGPARVLKPGLLRLAAATGALVLPLSASARPALRLASWDRLLIPWPFARATIVYGEPFEVPRDATAEQIAALGAHLEKTLTDLEEEADRGVATPARADGVAEVGRG